MSEEHFFQADQISPAEGPVKILALEAEPYPGGSRIRVTFQLSGYSKSLSSSLTLWNQAGEELASVTIVNIFNPHNEVTLHLPGSKAIPGTYRLKLALERLEEVESELEPGKVGGIESHPQDVKTISFTLSEQ